MATKQKNDLKYAIHPGVILKEYLNTLKMTQKQLSEKMNVGLTVVNEIINGKRSLSLNTALKLEAVLGLHANFWDNLQRNYLEKKKRIEKTSEINVTDRDVILQEKDCREFITNLDKEIVNKALFLAV